MNRLYGLVLAVTLISACGGGGDESEDVNDIGSNPDVSASCDFDPDEFTNGRNTNDADTYWFCTYEDDNYAEFAFFEDGTGISWDGSFSAFTWREISCGKIETQGAGGESTVDNLEGSIRSGILTFRLKSDGESNNFACVLLD